MLKTNGLATDGAVVPFDASVPPAIVTVPVPRGPLVIVVVPTADGVELAATPRTPAESDAPPVNVLLPEETIQVPVPDLTSLPAPVLMGLTSVEAVPKPLSVRLNAPVIGVVFEMTMLPVAAVPATMLLAAPSVMSPE